jgi:hypothetical protein
VAGCPSPNPVLCIRFTIRFEEAEAMADRERYREPRPAQSVGRHGLQALPIEGLAARLAGGFLQPIDPYALKSAIAKALSAELGDLDGSRTFLDPRAPRQRRFGSHGQRASTSLSSPQMRTQERHGG